MHDWSYFTKRISVNASKHKIFSSWLSQEALEKWFLSSAVFTNENGVVRPAHEQITKGDTYRWMWHGSDNVANGEVLDISDPDQLSFSFLGCKVDLSVKIEDGENIIELVQSNIPLDEESRVSLYNGCNRGWTFYLTNLKSIIEGGIDLRNRNINLMNVLNT